MLKIEQSWILIKIVGNTQKTAKNAKHRLIHYLLRRMELVHAAVELSAALFVRVENTLG